MKFTLIFTLVFLFTGGAMLANPDSEGFTTGDPDIQSINVLAFGPNDILFIGDSKRAKIFALKVDVSSSYEMARVNIEKIDVLLAEKLGADVGEISIQDMAIHQTTGNIFLAVHHLNTPVLFQLTPAGEMQWIQLNNVTYAEKSVANSIEEDAKDSRGRALRRWAISDIHYSNDKVMVTGLSNLEFGSTFRSLSYPFNNNQKDASLEIYHAAHGQYETHAPVKTFTTAEVNGEEQLIASYTCTPLVLFPLSAMEEGSHQKGRTVAELGAGNSPIDMIIVENEGQHYLLMNNSNRPVMKIALSDIAAFQGNLTEPVDVPGATEGVEYINFPMVNVIQMDNWGKNSWIMLKRESNGALNLVTGNQFWL